MGTIVTKYDFRNNNTDHYKNLGGNIGESGNISKAQSTFQLPSPSKPPNFPLIANGNGTLNLPVLEIRVWILRVIFRRPNLANDFRGRNFVILEGG